MMLECIWLTPAFGEVQGRGLNFLHGHFFVVIKESRIRRSARSEPLVINPFKSQQR